MSNTNKPLIYSPYKSQNREIARMSWDDAWGEYARTEWLPGHYVEQYRKSHGYKGYHANSRTVVCLRAYVRGVKIRMRELDRQATGDTTFCDTLFAS